LKIEEAIVLVLASSNHGMKIEQIAKGINEKGLITKWNKNPVDGGGLFSGDFSSGDIREIRWTNTPLLFEMICWRMTGSRL